MSSGECLTMLTLVGLWLPGAMSDCHSSDYHSQSEGECTCSGREHSVKGYALPSVIISNKIDRLAKFDRALGTASVCSKED